MKQKIEVIEVGPRDGFQSLKCEMVPTALKCEIIDRLAASGVRHLEYSSFVSPKAIPQLADAAEVTAYVLQTHKELDLFALVPNLRGAKSAYEAGMKKVVYVVSFSKSHNKANINRTHEESLTAFREIRQTFPDMEVIVDLATSFGCPFEGKYHDPEALAAFFKPYAEEGATTCCLCDTIGIADPVQVEETISCMKSRFPGLHLMVHFHDTRGLGMANTIAAIHAGVTDIQGALGGLGGCPFAPGASGNLATEDVVWALSEMGYETGIDVMCLIETAKWQAEHIEGNYSGHQIHI